MNERCSTGWMAGWVVMLCWAGGGYAEQQAPAVYQAVAHPYKPYVMALRTPGGLQPLLDSPHDHIHHHGLMYAVRVDDKNFWSESPDSEPGWQKPRPVTGDNLVPLGPGSSISQTIDWVDHEKTKRLIEQRSITMHGTVGQATLATWQALLQPAGGLQSVTLSGAHYEGLGMRFIRSFDGHATFLHQPGQPGKVFRGDERLTPGRWCAVHGMVDGRPVTVAMFDDPANPRPPAVWFTMAKPFAYLAATLSLHESPIVLKSGQSLGIRYGVALWDGYVEAGVIEQMHQRWLTLKAAEFDQKNLQIIL